MILGVLFWFIIGEEKKRKGKAWPKKCSLRKGKRGQSNRKRAACKGEATLPSTRAHCPRRAT